MEKADKLCLNCGQSIDSNYCPNCGQKTNNRRFDWSFFWNAVVNSIELNRGFLFSVIKLIIKPHFLISEYIKGKRQPYANPVKMIILTGALATFITFNFNFFDTQVEDTFIMNLPDVIGFFKYSSRYFSFFTLTAIPFFSFFTWFFFLKSGFNYVENIILNIYIAVGQFLILIMMSSLLVLISAHTLGLIYGAVNFGYNLWVVVMFFQVSGIKKWILSILAVAIPQVLVFFLNYFVYRIMPDTFWVFLDSLLT